MLKEELTTVRIKFNAKRYAVMLGSFLVLCVFIYVFHIVQSAIFYRTYITALSLLVLGLGIKLSKDRNTVLLWEASFVWFIYSLVFFDIRTHIQRFQGILILTYVAFPLFAYFKIYTKPYGIYARIFFSFFIACTPTLYANVYGNALYSILKLMSTVLLILTNGDCDVKLEEFMWPMFAHPIILLLVPFQIVSNVLKIIKPTRQEKKKEKTTTGRQKKNDIIGTNDVPFLFQNSV